MKLVEFLAELERTDRVPKSDKITESGGFMLSSENLKSFEAELFLCDEFKNVARINYLSMPTYLKDEETNEPIALNREFLGGKVKPQEVLTFRFDPSHEVKFEKLVDIYSITLFKRFLVNEKIEKPGIWVYPTLFDDAFEPTNQIKIIWNPDQIQEAVRILGNQETAKARLMRMFETALDSMEPNVPCEYVLDIRCSPRSIPPVEVIERPEGERAPSQSEPIFFKDGEIPPVQ